MGVDVAKLNGVANRLLVEGGILHVEVEKRHGIDVVELEVPVGALNGLLTYGEGGVEERAVLEELLVGVLHLDDEFLAILTLAIDVEDGLTLGIVVADVFGVEVLDVLDHLLAVEEAIEKADEQLLVGSRTKDALEPKVGQQADVSVFNLSHNGSCFSSSKVVSICEKSKS